MSGSPLSGGAAELLISRHEARLLGSCDATGADRVVVRYCRARAGVAGRPLEHHQRQGWETNGSGRDPPGRRRAGRCRPLAARRGRSRRQHLRQMFRRTARQANRRHGDSPAHAGGWRSVEWRRDPRSGERKDLPGEYETHRGRPEARGTRLHRPANLWALADLVAPHGARLTVAAPDRPGHRGPPPAWLFSIAAMPYGAFNGVVAVAIPYLLRK